MTSSLWSSGGYKPPTNTGQSFTQGFSLPKVETGTAWRNPSAPASSYNVGSYGGMVAKQAPDAPAGYAEQKYGTLPTTQAGLDQMRNDAWQSQQQRMLSDQQTMRTMSSGYQKPTYTTPTYNGPTYPTRTGTSGGTTPDVYSTNPVKPASTADVYSTQPVRPASQQAGYDVPPVGAPMGLQPDTWVSPGSSMGGGYGVGPNDAPAARPPAGTATGAPPFTNWGMPDDSWKNLDPTAVANYASIGIPMSQLQQSSYQYGTDFNEGVRRWDIVDARTERNDLFDQGIAGRSMSLQEQVANWDQLNATQKLQLEQELGRGGLANSVQQTANQAAYQQGQLGNERIDLAQKDWYNRAQVGIAAQANGIDQMWKSGQLSNEQRSIALGELTQKQNDAFRYKQMENDAGLTREGYQNQQKLAAMNAFGRVQAPRSRWVRSW